MHTCCVCLHKFEGEEPPILMPDEQGRELVLCPDCAPLVEAVAGTPDGEERSAAIKELSSIDVKNTLVLEELARLINREDAPPVLEEEALLSDREDAPSVPPLITKSDADLSLWLGLSCLAAALILFIILKVV